LCKCKSFDAKVAKVREGNNNEESAMKTRKETLFFGAVGVAMLVGLERVFAQPVAIALTAGLFVAMTSARRKGSVCG